MNFSTTKSKNFLIILLLAACLFSACAKQEGAKRATVLDVFGITEENPNKNTKEIVFTEDGGWERNADHLSDSKNKTVASDGSQITETKDAFGNITYERTFKNDPRLKAVTIVKSSGGGQVIYIYGKGTGKVVRLTDETAEKGMEMSADDLADRAKLLKPIRTSSFDEPLIGSSLPVKNPVAANQDEEDFYNNFPNETEENSPPTEQAKIEDSEENQPEPPQTADNN